MSTEATSPLNCCSVCLSPEKVSRNFGSNTCSPCAAFFRRTVALKIRFTCKNGDSCTVTREARSGCRSCRFLRCETAGMKRQLVQSRGEKNDRLPEYIKRGRENGSTEVVRGFVTSIYGSRSDSNSNSCCVSPTPSSNSSFSTTASSAVCMILDVTSAELLNYYVVIVRASIAEWKDALDTSSFQNFLESKLLGDKNAWSLCSNCPGVDLLHEDELPILHRFCSFTNVWMDSAWMKTLEYNNSCETSCSESKPSSPESFRTLVSQFHSTVTNALSNLQLDLVEYSALKALCIWKLGLVDFTLTLKIVAQEQYCALTQALTSYYRSEKKLEDMEIALRIANITLLLGPIFECYCQVMRFYEGFSSSR